MKKEKKRRLTSLFFRILGGIAIPMLLLLVTFTTLFLRRELAIQKRLYTEEGGKILEELDKGLKTKMTEAQNQEASMLSKEDAAHVKKKLGFETFDLIDPSSQRSWLTPSREISKKELERAQASLSLKREGKPYYLIVDEPAKMIRGYLPVRNKARNQILVAAVSYPMATLQQALSETFATVITLIVMIVGAAFYIAMSLTVRIVRPIREINRACRQMLAGNLGLQVNVKTGDELEVMASNFNKMSQALLAMTKQATDLNPLTQLPGNREITAELSSRIEQMEKFIFFHADIDHFKAYNDHYGLARGDDVLRRTGEIFSEVVREAGSPHNFLGHQGGDDFVLILEPSSAKAIADKICKSFDAALKTFYDQEDFDRGYFMGVEERSESITESNEPKRHPLMSISLAGVSNLRREFASYEDILDRAVPVKKKAKKIPYSKFLIEE